MARKYFAEFTSIVGTDYRVEIWDAPTGSSTGGTELRLSGAGFTIDAQGEGDPIYEKFIRKSRATAYFIVDNDTDEAYFQNLAVDDEGKYAIVIYKGTALYWIGRILPDQMQWSRQPVSSNVEFQIASVDTLSLLENYTIDPTWFSATTYRLNILDLIRLCLSRTGLHLYWEHLGFSSDYIRDAVQSYMGTTRPNEFTKKWEVWLSSMIQDLELYTAPKQGDSIDIFFNCEDVVEELLGIFGGRFFLDSGKYWIIQPIAYSVYPTSIDYRVYSTAGIKTNTTIQNFAHKTNIGTTVRPKFESFPVHTNQPAVRYFEQRFKRVNLKQTVKPKASASSSVFSLNSFFAFQGSNIKVRSTLNFGAYFPSGVVPAASKVYIAFRAYTISGSSVYRKYNANDKTWDTVSAIPDYESVECKVFKIEPSSFNAIITIDFFREMAPPLSNTDNIHMDFQIIGLTNRSIGASTSTGLLNWGDIMIWQDEDSEKKVVVSNLTNTNASKIVSKEVRYYANGTQAFGNCRGNVYVVGIDQVDNWESVTGRNDPMNSALAGDFMSVHAKAVRVIQGNWIDAGTYARYKTLYFDDSIYVFNGGKFNALYEQWEAEWIRVAYDVDLIDVNGEEDFEDYKSGQKDAIVRLLKETNEIRESVSDVFQAVPFRILRDGIGAPTIEPTISTNYGVNVNFNPSDQVVEYSLKELGAFATLTAGTYTLTNYFEIYLCNSAGGSIGVTLPDATTVKGNRYTFKKISSSHTVTIFGTIDSHTSITLHSNHEVVTIISNGVQYYIL